MRARLIVTQGIAEPAELFLSGEEEIFIGRLRENHLVLHDEHASRRHVVLYVEDGQWMLREWKPPTTNGTRVDSRKVTSPVPLQAGQTIAIGQVRLRFMPLPDGPAPPTEELPRWELLPDEDTGEQSSITPLHTDELSAVFEFLRRSYQQGSPRSLVSSALKTVMQQLKPTVCGFLSLDADDPLPRMVLPAEAQVDIPLSRRLTEKALRRKHTIWLAQCEDEDLDSGSLATYQDAICVPLGVSSTDNEIDAPLGALHIYRTHTPFHENEVRFCEVLGGCLSSGLRVLQTRQALEADNSRLRIRAPGAGDSLIGDSQVVQQLRQQVRRLASYPCSILIIGETGAGKELVALGLHRQSSRRRRPLVEVNCASIVAGMADAQLFGHEEGAFTSASKDRPGYFQLADGGTLFLDEVAELPLECQAKLLRVLETRKVHPVGAPMPISVDVRIIAATHRDLEQEVRAGRFREDLFYRLGMTIKVPSLRDHLEDIPALAEHFLGRLREEYHRDAYLTEQAVQRLAAFHWPGNVRQLRLVLERAIAMSETGIIEPEDLQLGPPGPPPGPVPTQECLNLEEVEKQTILLALQKTGGNRTQAAQLLGIHRETLINKLKKYRLDGGG